MIQHITLEALYPEMEEATIGRWLVQEGSVVTEGQPIAELITDKVAYEYQSATTGTILAILPAEKSVVPVNTILAVVGDAGEMVSDLAKLLASNRHLATAREASLGLLLAASAVQQPQGVGTATPRAVRATPAARRLARERGIDLSIVKGSGADGMITVDDL